MDPFTQRMLERARARQEKIDQKLASSGQSVPKRKPLTENVPVRADSVKSPVKAIKESVNTPKKSPRRSSQNREMVRNDVVITKKELRKHSGESKCEGRRSSDMSVEISIKHSDDIQIEVQVEEREVPINVVYGSGSGVVIKEIEDNNQKEIAEKNKSDKTNVRHNFKSRLDRLGNLYSDNPNISSPIHRTEAEFSAATPPFEVNPPKASQAQAQRDGKKKFGRLAALADQINNWEDDTTHHTHQIDSEKPTKTKSAKEKLEASTLDVSIHSISDINKVLKTTPKSNNKQTPVNSSTYTKPSTPQHLNKNIVAGLEGDGYRRVSASQSRLVYDFTATENADRDRQEPKCASTTPSAASAPKMATMVAGTQNNTTSVTKKPSIKKYRAPTPPRKLSVDECESDKDKENNVVDREENDNESDSCVQTKQPADDDKPATGSPVIRRLAPKLNGNVDRNSVLSRAAMFEAGSPRAKEKDPAEMSLRERKALFEKNKGAAIVPKAPFGQAPSAKTLHGVNKADKPAKPVVQKTNSRSNSKENLPDDNISQSSFGGGIKGKLAALFNREQTISESTIANKFKQEREKEMEVLQNRFNYKPPPKPEHADESDDDDQSDNDPSEKAPLMGSTTSLSQLNKKPEIIANIPKVTFDDKAQSEPADKEANEPDKVVGAQPCKRRSSQDSPVVLSVVDEVKRIKVNDRKDQANGAVVKQPTIYPHLSDIETDTSNTQEEYSDCGGSRCGYYALDSENPNEALNKSDNWGDTSFGREVLNVVKKNNSSYKKAVRNDDDSDSSHSACDSELDDMLDEALDANSDGPTPPKLNKGSMSSTSFEYKNREFKSPLKHPATPATPRHDKANELVHSISFYRRMQNASSNPSTPLRVIRHGSPEREMPETPDEPSAGVPVRQRIKELQAEIAKQQTVISQASQALNLCAATIEFSGSTEQAEGERLLLLATHRRQACVHEVQRLQVEGAGAAAAAGIASLSIKGITVPLRRDYVRHLNADGAVGHYGVCLVKCRDRVAATAMVRTRTDSHLLHFADHIRMDGLAKDFKVTVEVYLLQASKEILSHEVKYHIGNKKGSSKLLTPKSKMSSLKAPRVQSPAGPLAVRSPQFQLHGYCIFALQQANRKTFTLNKVPCGSPLEGSVNVELAAHLRVNAPPPRAAFLTAFEDVAGLGAWHRRWFRLHPPATNLAYWKYPDDVHKKLPMGDIDLTSVVSERVTKAPRDLCARPNTLLLETSLPAGMPITESGSLIYVRKPDGSMVRRHLLAADTAQDRDMWLDSLNKALEYVRCCHPEDE